ncbi:hypothetical protein PTSG_13152 [Salpingoeca rosetta]|uniref:non-specific serine/threonine protein kinase n=1 Tax=Salpingoeca rosetta (strain ATCC 50818 / BSB-021) TaxID=946362 RepID=F2USR5_SALR5|nr:uncharacterized protein PTSG_13152 [Salpingoeca rosetta]EGD81174.1 hypothetical protein PTSG_13152 [Salpingoeca rosetta]|eukprot:XP_004987859.1 hypothetical protein PTSG_13152 [Salpingoeca rosetta]
MSEKRARREVEALLAQTKLPAKKEKRVKDKIRAIANNTCGEIADLYDAGLGVIGARAVAEALKDNTCLKRLYLDNNSIGDEGAVALAEMLKHNTTLKELFLYNNSIGDEGAVALAEMLKHNTTLKRLDLDGNSIGPEGAVALAEMLKHNTALKQLHLTKNSITPVGGAALGAALDQNRTLSRLEINKNSTATARAFGAALPVDRELYTDWSGDDEGKAAFNEAREEKKRQHEQLFAACRDGDASVVTSLMEQDNADINQQDKRGDTPLHVACRHNQPAVVELLLKKGADTAVKNIRGGTPFMVAQKRNFHAITSIPGLDPDSKPQQQPQQQQQQPKQEQQQADMTASDTPDTEHVHREAVQARMMDIAERSDTHMAGRAKMGVSGQGRAGKTTLVNSLRGKPFNKQQHSTLGATTDDMRVTVHTMEVCDWKESDQSTSEFIRSLVGTAMAREAGVDEELKRASAKAQAQHATRVNQHQRENEDKDAKKQRKKGRDTSTTSTPSSDKASTAAVPAPAAGRDASTATPAAKEQHPASSHADVGDDDADVVAVTTPSVSKEEVEKAIKDMDFDATIREGKMQVSFKIFDLGGQSTFYVFHPFFLTKYAVYLLVFSMEDLLHQDESKRTEAWEFMEHWLSSLHLHAKGAPVLIVGTFADVVSKRKQHEHISRDIHSRLRHNPAFASVVYNSKHKLWFWPVDNTKSIGDPMIQGLRQTISSTALAQEYVSQEVAVPYLHLYDKLNAIARDEKRPLLTFDEVVQIARTCGLRTREETRACLQFLHLYSMVLYYDSVPGMEDYVILSPQWAVDTMTRVIRTFGLHDDDVQGPEVRALGADVWDDLVDRGILHRRLLEVLWRDVDSDLVDPFLRLMMQYGLCIQYSPPKLVDSRRALARANSGHGDNDGVSKGNDAHQRQQHQQQQYLVPAILPMTIRHNNSTMASVSLSTTAAQQANPYLGHEEKTAYVAFSLKQFKRSASVRAEHAQHASFLPEGLFTVVLAHVMAHAQHGASQEPQLSRTHAICFMESTKLELQLVPAVGGIKMKITSAQPRAMLHMLHTMISEAARERYPELKSSLLLPYDDKTLLFFEDVLHHHKSKQDMWVDEQLLSPDDLVAKYGPLLPVLGLQDKYDVFISYRQRANSGLVMALHPRLEQRNLVAFLDANNLETGLNFKLSFMTAIGLSLVVCPIASAATIMQMRQLQHSDYCDNVLLEWMTMLALHEFQRAHEEDEEQQHAKIRLRRVVPVIVGSAWHNVNDSSSMSRAEVSEYDSFDRLKRLAMTLPDVVSKETAVALDQYFTQVLHLPPPQQHKSVRETVLSLFDIDAVVALNAVVDRTSQLRDIAEKVRQVAVSARSDEQTTQEAGTARRSTQQSSLSLSSTTATTPAPPPPATPSSSSSSSLPFEPDLVQWLNRHSLLPHVESALVEHGIDCLEVLVVSVHEDLLTMQMLKGAGVRVGHAVKLVREAMKCYVDASSAY